MVKRELYMSKIRPFIDKDIIKVITGIRRSGKSYLLHLIIDELIERGVNKDNILLIDLELARYNYITKREELDKIVLEFLNRHEDNVYLFFDEIQNVEDWEISIAGYYKLRNTDIYLTGSNSKLLSEELATRLTGRFINFRLYPFSFNEFIEYKKELHQEEYIKNSLNTEIENLFEEFVEYGGLPFTISATANKITTLKDLYSSIIYNDIVKRYNIRNIALFERITKYLIENIGNLISGNSIYNHFKHENIDLTKNTIYNYLNYLEKAFLLSKVTREDMVVLKELTGSEKFYLIDQGFYKSELEEKHQNRGRLLENIIYIELLRQDFKVTVGRNNNYEVDFICRKDNTKCYIQVSYSITDEKTRERELRSLLKIQDNYPKYILSMDKIDLSGNGIKHMNIIEFLMKENTLNM